MDEALKIKQFTWKRFFLKITQRSCDIYSGALHLAFFRPIIPEDEVEEEAIGDDDAEVTVNKVEEEMFVCSW